MKCICLYYVNSVIILYYNLCFNRFGNIMEQKYEDEIQTLKKEIEMLEAEQEETLRSIFIEHGDRLQQELLVTTLMFVLCENYYGMCLRK